MFGLISHRRHDAELAAARAVSDRLRGERDAARAEKKAFRYAAATGAEQVIDVSIVNDCLTRDLTVLKKRVERLRKVGARLLAAYARERLRAVQLQRRLDDAVGLTSPALDAGRHWQERRTDKTTAKESS